MTDPIFPELKPISRDFPIDVNLRKNSGWSFLAGIALILLGVLAIAFPALSTLASVVVFGCILIGAGISHGIQAFTSGKLAQDRFFQILMGLLDVVVGVVLVTQPAIGAVSLTLLMGSFFVVSGIFRMISASTLGYRNAGWVLLSGVIGFALGILLLIGWPAISAVTLGIFIGIDLLMMGWSLVMLSSELRRQWKEPFPRPSSATPSRHEAA